VGMGNPRILIQPTDLSSTAPCSIGGSAAAIGGFACDCEYNERSDGSSRQTCHDMPYTCFDTGGTNCFACANSDDFEVNFCLHYGGLCTTCFDEASNTCYLCLNGDDFDGPSSCLQCYFSCEICSGPGASACLACYEGASAEVNSQYLLVCDGVCNTCYNTNVVSCSTCYDRFSSD